MREALKSKVLTPPLFHYSQVVKVGPNYYCSGMLALDNQSGKLVDEGPGGQARTILRNLELLMGELGLGWEDLAIVRIFTTRFEAFGEINQAWEEVFGAITPPARTSVGVNALPMGAAVEMEFTFHKE